MNSNQNNMDKALRLLDFRIEVLRKAIAILEKDEATELIMELLDLESDRAVIKLIHKVNDNTETDNEL